MSSTPALHRSHENELRPLRDSVPARNFLSSFLVMSSYDLLARGSGFPLPDPSMLLHVAHTAGAAEDFLLLNESELWLPVMDDRARSALLKLNRAILRVFDVCTCIEVMSALIFLFERALDAQIGAEHAQILLARSRFSRQAVISLCFAWLKKLLFLFYIPSTL